MQSLVAGLDSGSWCTKVVLIDDSAAVLGRAIVRSGADLAGAARAAFIRALIESGGLESDVVAAVSTGFGRHTLHRELPVVTGTRTELDCHARGVHHHVSGALSVVDIGGQDAKVIQIGADGRRLQHRMNRKSAAGTGSFIEEMALRLSVSTSDLPALAAAWSEEVNLGSFCTVFSATELLSLIRQGKRPADLARAAYRSVVRRVLEMVELNGTVVATGGVAGHHPMVLDLLGEALGVEVVVPPHPQEAGAFGAALVALRTVTTEGQGA